MKKVTLVLFVVLAAVLIGQSASFAQSSTATATAKAKVVRPLQLTWIQPLEFGVLMPGATAGHATIDVSGIGATAVSNGNVVPMQPTTDGGLTAFNTVIAEGPATFLAEGEPGWTFTIAIPPSVLAPILTPLNPIGIATTPVLELDEFNTNQPGSYVPVFLDPDPVSAPPNGSGSGVGGIGTLDGTTGARYFAVGARVRVEPTDPSGQYTGQFNVTVAYN